MADIDIIMFVSITEHAIMNSTPGRSGTSYPARRLLEDSEKFLPVKDSVLVEAQYQSLDRVGNFYQTVMPTLQSFPAGVPVPRQTDELTQEDGFQIGHILEQSTENSALQSDFIAVSQSDQVTDPVQPTSFLTYCNTMLQTSHSHSGATKKEWTTVDFGSNTATLA